MVKEGPATASLCTPAGLPNNIWGLNTSTGVLTNASAHQPNCNAHDGNPNTGTPEEALRRASCGYTETPMVCVNEVWQIL